MTRQTLKRVCDVALERYRIIIIIVDTDMYYAVIE